MGMHPLDRRPDSSEEIFDKAWREARSIMNENERLIRQNNAYREALYKMLNPPTDLDPENLGYYCTSIAGKVIGKEEGS